ncbi:MAG TPA: hypothetical protein ACQGQH_05475 [Xylella sp.]
MVTEGYGAGEKTLSIFPCLIPTTPKTVGNVDKAPKDRAAITVVGTPSVPAIQNIVFHRDAFAMAFAPCPCWLRIKAIPRQLRASACVYREYIACIHTMRDDRFNLCMTASDICYPNNSDHIHALAGSEHHAIHHTSPS